jgi:hypothetical protein
LPENLAAAWSDGTANALAITKALSDKVGKVLPWLTLRRAIDGALTARLLERAPDSGPWPCDYAGAKSLLLIVPREPTTPPLPPPPRPDVRIAEADLRSDELQDFADVVGKLVEVAAGRDLRFHLRIEVGNGEAPIDDVVKALNKVLENVSKELRLKLPS